MQVKKILKSPEKGEAYYHFILQFEMYTLGWVGVTGIVYTTLFIILDYWRVTHYTAVASLRILAFLLYAVMAWFSFITKANVRALHSVCYFMSTSLFTVGFLLDYYGGMPIFFLPNYLCLHLFVFNSALGHPLKFKVASTIATFGVFVLYALKLSPHQVSHVAQAWNILLNGTLSLLIGYLIERYRLLNFVSRIQLIESRKKNVELNNLKTKLISILSHDIASPLNTLKGLLQLNEKSNISADELQNHTKNVNVSLENLSSTMSNLLRWSKTQLVGFNPTREVIDLKELVDEISGSLDFATTQKQLTIRNEINGHRITGDREILKMVLRNFLSNAIKFSRTSDTIVVSTIYDVKGLSVSVRDNGIGMSDTQMKRLFSSRVTPARGTNNEKGSGIGLIMSRDFVEMMGGTISVQSVEGKGSEFKVTFPAS